MCCSLCYSYYLVPTILDGMERITHNAAVFYSGRGVERPSEAVFRLRFRNDAEISWSSVSMH
jgi:hypothetical protein